MAEPSDPDSLPTQQWSGSAESSPPVTQRAPGSGAGPQRGGWQPPEPAELQASFPQYEIRDVLGRGGMGAVYKGWQKSLRRFVAIKILPPGLEDHGANFAERFQREAQAMARFSHPGIVAVFDAGETADGLFYFVMEYIEGTDVQKMVRESGPLPPEHALAITAHVCDALAYAHKRGVIHRDIKPANIMVDAEGQVKVADFGLAKVANDDSAALVTGTHVSMGTADFMAPEALYGMGAVDHRADLYAVGVMLYQMLTGEVPRGLFDMPSKHRDGIDPRFDEIVKRAMQRDPEKRYASATDIRTDLDKILTEPVPHRSAAAPTPPPGAGNGEALPVPLGQRKVSDSEAWGAWQPAQGSTKPRGDSAQQPTPPPAPRAVQASPSAPRRRRWVWLTSGIATTLLLFAAGAIFFHDRPKAPPAAALHPDEIERIKQTIPPLEVVLPPPSLEPGAIRLWDAPEKIPKGEGISWQDNAVSLRKASLKGDPSSHDAVLRASIRADSIGAVLALRSKSDGSAGYFRLTLEANRRISLRNSTAGPTLISWELPRDYAPSEWIRFEFRVVGDEASVAVDGKPVGTFRDSAVSGPGQPMIYGSAECSFRDVVYVPLDKAASAGAPTGLSAVPDSAQSFAGHRYQFVPDKGLTWQVARKRAEAMGGHLVTVTSEEEHLWLKEVMKPYLVVPNRSCWTGGMCDGPGQPWRWITGEAFDYQPWPPERPNYSGKLGATEPYYLGYVFKSDGIRWDDVGISESSGNEENVGYLVEWDEFVSVLSTAAPDPVHTFAGHRYQFVPGAMTWAEARVKAESLGGHLATITSQEESEWIYRTFGTQLESGLRASSLWLGGTTEASGQPWKWITGEPFVFADWNKGEPDYSTTTGVPVKGPFGICIKNHQRLHWFDDPVDRKNANAGFLIEWDDDGRTKSAASAPPVATPATTTKDSPFINILGMQFIPVPITGGPTGGKRVLFSTWETRVCDYGAFTKETGRRWENPGFPQEIKHPAVMISWDDAQAFCAWLTERERKAGKIGVSESYRLPSDHEWSCAVGLGDREDPAQTPDAKNGKIEGIYPWGRQWPPPAGVGNLTGEEMQPDFAAKTFPWLKSPIAGYRDTFTRTSPVGSFPVETNGLYDLSGNVREWCQDAFPPVADGRVIRGGSWSQSDEFNLRSSSRNGRAPSGYEPSVGFRVVLAPVP